MPFTPEEDLHYRQLLGKLRHLWKALKQADRRAERHGPRPAAYLDIEAKIRAVGREIQRMLQGKEP